MQVRRFAQYPKRAWKNGLGVTRLVAEQPANATDSTLVWSVSVPEIEHDCTFSAYAGMDRHLLLLEGEGVDLRCSSAGEHVDFTHRIEASSTPFSFRGEWDIACTLAGANARVLSAIGKRDAVSMSVTPKALAGTATVIEKRADEALVLFVAAGTVRVLGHGNDTQPPLARFDSIVALDHRYASLALSPQGFAAARVVVIRVSTLG